MTPEEKKIYHKNYNKERYKNNKEKINKCAKKYREKNKEKIKEYKKKYNQKNKERYIESSRKYKINNREILRINNFIWREKNRELLSDSYISSIFNIPRKLFETEEEYKIIIDLYRKNLLLKRALREKNKNLIYYFLYN